MKKIYNILFILIISILINCNGTIKNFNNEGSTTQDSIITISEFPNKNVLLTSYMDGDFLLLFIPFEIEIKKKKEEEIFNISSFIYECGFDAVSNIKYLPTKSTKSFSVFTSDDFKKGSIENKLMQYRYVKIYPKKDTIAKSFKNKLKFIKANSKKSNKYFNDTIRYRSMNEFIVEHRDYYDKEMKCEKVKVKLMLKKDTIYTEYFFDYQFKN